MSAFIWIGVCLLVVTTEAVPANFACTRKINVGDVIMAGQFQSSTAVSIMLGSTACGGNLQTGVSYTPTPTGLNSTNRYVIDIGTESGDPFSGANFTQGFLVYNGKTIKATGIAGNMTAWTAFSGTRLNNGNPVNCPTRTADYANSRVVFSTPGQVVVRIAWSNGALDGAMVSTSCRYTITDSATTAAGSRGTTAAATTPAPNHAVAGAPTRALSLFILALTVIQYFSITMT
jgi:hypothetical protein